MIHERPIPGGEPEKEMAGAVTEETVVSEAGGGEAAGGETPGGGTAEGEMGDAEEETADGCCRGSES